MSRWMFGLIVALAAPRLAAQTPPTPTAPIKIDVRPYTVPEPGRTRWYQVADGMMGQRTASKLGRGVGIDWKQFMTGTAYGMKFAPDGGPDCDPRKPDAKVEFWTIDADPNLSRLAVNPATQVGLLFVRGVVKRYVQASDWCDTKRFALTATDAGFLYVPFGAQGWSPRNFTASALVPLDANGASTAGRVVGLFSGPGISERLGGYLSDAMLGQSQALGEGPGAEMTAEALTKYAGAGTAAAAAIKDMPGLVPGAKSEGWIDLNLSDRPVAAIQGSRGGAFFYVHVRAVHSGQEIQPGPGYRWLQELVRDHSEYFTDPAKPTAARPPN